jgi:proliferating cell nuclear antigen
MMKRSVEIKTVQSTAFKTLVEAVKEIITDTVIDIDSSGIKIATVDNSHTVLVHVRLEAEKFEAFACTVPKSIGVNLLNLHKIIKCINNNDILTLFMIEGDDNVLGIMIENIEKSTTTTYHLSLLDLDNENLEIPPATFQSLINIPSNDLQKIVRDMNNLANFVDIKSCNNQLTFKCTGEFCSQETVLSEYSNGFSSQPIGEVCDHNIVQGEFDLKYLVLFTKCTNLCNTVRLYLKNDYPLVVNYNIASLGEIKLCLSPRSCDDHDL